MDTHHPGDSGFWILGVGRMSRVEGPSDSGFWILDTGRRRSEVPVGRAGSDSGFWILDTGQSVGGPGREGRLDSGFLDSGYWAFGRRSREGGPSDSGFWILDTGRSEVPGGRAVGLWILDSGNWGPLCAREGRCRLDSGFLDSGFCSPPLAWICSPPLGTAWILDSWILETARIQNPDARILDPGFWILDSAQRASAHA